MKLIILFLFLFGVAASENGATDEITLRELLEGKGHASVARRLANIGVDIGAEIRHGPKATASSMEWMEMVEVTTAAGDVVILSEDMSEIVGFRSLEAQKLFRPLEAQKRSFSDEEVLPEESIRTIMKNVAEAVDTQGNPFKVSINRLFWPNSPQYYLAFASRIDPRTGLSYSPVSAHIEAGTGRVIDFVNSLLLPPKEIEAAITQEEAVDIVKHKLRRGETINGEPRRKNVAENVSDSHKKKRHTRLAWAVNTQKGSYVRTFYIDAITGNIILCISAHVPLQTDEGAEPSPSKSGLQDGSQ